MVNFFNPLDFALDLWVDNQNFYAAVPDAPPGDRPITMKPATLMGYYTDGTSHLLRENGWNKSIEAILQGTYYIGPPRTVVKTHEIMPFISRPRSKAVGAQAGIHGEIQGVEMNLQSQLGFGSRTTDHSGQWNRNIQDPALVPFYFELRANLFPEAP